RFQVAVIDCGMKMNIVRMLNQNKCNVTVVPCSTSAEEILSLAPDGVLISNGPGDPQDVPEVIAALRELRGKVPMFGICFGHQLLGLACGAKTYKLKFGHRGGNHPVRDLWTGRIEITSQNHSYAVDESSLSGTGLTVSHINVLDQTVEGLRSEKERIFSVQFHPESAPGPQDSMHLFRQFTDYMKRG
ncbi:MAG: carbamoyl phosphate synthase small subunit, partial [Lachnospiraceae bacterium]|nr:carbamoyl phosphate synthase small subunit [Lachnospiraceae bacterium]